MAPDRDRRMSLLGPVVAGVLAAAVVGGGYLVRANADPAEGTAPTAMAMHDMSGMSHRLSAEVAGVP